MRALAILLAFVGAGQAADLSEIDRTITAAPAFTAERQFYALLVLGMEAKTRIWFVLDGSNLHVDSNGNGNLTDDGKPIRGHKSSSGFIARKLKWRVPELKALPRYSDIRVKFSIVNPKWRPSRKESKLASAAYLRHMERFMTVVRRTSHANLSSIWITIDGKRKQFCNAMFTTSPKTAPIFHMDGPLSLGVVESFVPGRLERAEQPEPLAIAVGTPGFGGDQPGCFSYVMYTDFPDEARPVAEVAFPAREKGRYLAPRPFELPGKC